MPSVVLLAAALWISFWPPPKSVRRLVELVRSEVTARLGSQATFEQRREAAAALMAEALAKGLDYGGDEDQCDEFKPTAGGGTCTSTPRRHK